jgi:hypothetical protein
VRVAAGAWCALVVLVRRRSTALRRAVGWTLSLREILYELGGDSLQNWMAPPGTAWDTTFFFDAHLVALLVLGAGPILLRKILVAFLWRPVLPPPRWEVPPSKKEK